MSVRAVLTRLVRTNNVRGQFTTKIKKSQLGADEGNGVGGRAPMNEKESPGPPVRTAVKGGARTVHNIYNFVLGSTRVSV